jgi:hypothetical protein
VFAIADPAHASVAAVITPHRTASVERIMRLTSEASRLR